MGKGMVLIVGGAILLLLAVWYINGALVTPVEGGKNISLQIYVRALGSAPELEHTICGLLWLIDNGTIPGEIVICDMGMDEYTRMTAQLLARDDSRILFGENWEQYGSGEGTD